MNNIFPKIRVHLTTLLLIIGVGIGGSISAQNKGISGRVLSDSKQPIVGATIVIEGANIGTTTDLDGKFTIAKAPTKGSMSVSYLGYVSKRIEISGQKSFYEVTLKEDSKEIDEVVVVGYGQMRKKELTGAVTRIGTEEINALNTSDIGNAIQGQVAGVNVQFSDGAPGSVANIHIRGISSVTGSNSPLYVVDGVPYDGDPGLSSSEIESLDILKDAASAAIYGTRGAGGVILITTKQGKEGAAKVNVEANYGIQNITSKLYTMDNVETLAVHTLKNMRGDREAANNTHHVISNDITRFMNNTNMMSLIEQNNQPITNISVNISGGKNGSTYSVMGNYYTQDGIIVNSSFERLNLRANNSFKVKKFTFSTSLSTVISDKSNADNSLYAEVYRQDPTNDAFDPYAGSVTTAGDTNDQIKTGMTMQRFKEENTLNSKSFNGNVSIRYDIMKGLSFTSRASLGYQTNLGKILNPIYKIFNEDNIEYIDSRFRSGVRNTTTNRNSMTWENMLNYNFDIKKHSFKTTLVGSIEERSSESYYAERKDLINNDLSNVGAATGDMSVGVSGGDSESTLIGMLARMQYDYDDRYLFSASIRRDGSSRFTSKNRWGIFPSLSAGWNVAEEKFWSNAKDVVNALKLRASYGTTGNQNFADYSYAATISSGFDYGFGGEDGTTAIYDGFTQTGYANENVMWETTKQINAGVDISFLKSRLNVTADIYKSSKENMLFSVKVPPSNGTGTTGAVILNVGNMENKGVEFAANWRDKIGDLKYNISFTASRNVNEITKMSGSNENVPLGQVSTIGSASEYVTFLQEGYEAGAFMLLPTDGVVNTDAKLRAYQKIVPSAQMGDLIYVDTDKDGSITDNDRIYYGSGAPEVELGANIGVDWKGFDLAVRLYGSIGNEIIDGSKISAYKNMRHLDLMNMWSIYNQNSTIPIYVDASHNNLRSSSDYWISDGSFFRIQNITLGYTLPKNIIAQLGLTKVRVYFAADNILTLSKYAGYNPGVGNDGLRTRGIDNGTYPLASQVRGGIQIGF